MGGTGVHPDLRRARRRGQPAEPPAARGRACSPATTSRSAWRTTTATSRSCGAATTPALVYTACSSAAHQRRAARTSSTTAGRRSSSRRSTRPTRPPRSSPTRRTSQLRLMLDGTIDGYESLRGGRRRAARRRRSTSARRGHRHALLVGHDRPPEGRRPRPFDATAARDAPDAVAAAAAAAVRRRRATASTSPRRRSTTPPRCASAWRCTRSAAPSWRWSTSTPSSTSRSSSATGVTHSQVVPTMFVRMLKLPEDVRDALRRVVAAVRHPRRGAVPGAGQAADDRVVRPDHPRVLRRHRGQRLRVLQQRDVAGPPGHRRHADRLRRSTSATTTATSCPSARSGTDLLRGRRDVRVPQRPGEDARRRATRRAGARSATSATSTTTASSTSPTARRT